MKFYGPPRDFRATRYKTPSTDSWFSANVVLTISAPSMVQETDQDRLDTKIEYILILFWAIMCFLNSIINNNGDPVLRNDSYLLVFRSRHYSDDMSVFYGIRGSASETEDGNEICFINILSDNVIHV